MVQVICANEDDHGPGLKILWAFTILQAPVQVLSAITYISEA